MNHEKEEIIVINDFVIPKESFRNLIFEDLANIKKEIRGKHYVRNDEAISVFLKALSMIWDAFKDGNCSVDGEMFSPTCSSGSITITGKDLCFDAGLLKEVLEMCSEVEIAPYNDGVVEIIIGFRNLMVLE